MLASRPTMTKRVQPLTFGEGLRAARQAHGYSLRDLGKLVGVSPPFLSDVENDRRVPSEGVLARIAGALGLPYDALVAQSGRLDAETLRYLKHNPAAIALVRLIVERGLDEDELLALTKQVAEAPR